MSGSAIAMMVVALGLVWGGLATSLMHLRRNPDDTSGLESAERPHE
ncbi:methionine/alanine import family NSS transporter small subunit [Rhodococcus ruber]|nr:methionine/alanine import family NSS transporter small subunit [Rhodococcus ruber]MDO1477748.1 methionine/alanine import family NSS transporter small subunit [Rhodococcus ruber]